MHFTVWHFNRCMLWLIGACISGQVYLSRNACFNNHHQSSIITINHQWIRWLILTNHRASYLILVTATSSCLGALTGNLAFINLECHVRIKTLKCYLPYFEFWILFCLPQTLLMSNHIISPWECVYASRLTHILCPHASHKQQRKHPSFTTTSLAPPGHYNSQLHICILHRTGYKCLISFMFSSISSSEGTVNITWRRQICWNYLDTKWRKKSNKFCFNSIVIDLSLIWSFIYIQIDMLYYFVI